MLYNVFIDIWVGIISLYVGDMMDKARKLTKIFVSNWDKDLTRWEMSSKIETEKN